MVVVQAYSPLVSGNKRNDEMVRWIGKKKFNKSWAQVLIRWSLQKRFVPLPKSIKPERVRVNTQVCDLELDEEDIRRLEMGDEHQNCTWDPTEGNRELLDRLKEHVLLPAGMEWRKERTFIGTK